MEKKLTNITLEAIEADEKPVQNYNVGFVFNEKNYLNTKLEKGQNSKELRIRLLPVDKNSNSPFKTIYMHTVTVPPEVSPKTPWKSYICLSKTEDIDHEILGSKCPFCELNQEAYKNMKEWQEKYQEAKKKYDSTKDETYHEEMSRCEVEADRWKTISLKNKPSEGCLMRVIERGAEEDGTKFWKTNVRGDKKDPKNLIKALFKNRYEESIEEAKEENGGVLPEDFEPENILDVETGKDLKITITRVFTNDGKPTDKTTISIVDYGKNKPLSNDPDEMEKWINDEKVWSDVFVAKPYDYLSLIIDGEVPFYDKANKKWIPKIRKKDGEAEVSNTKAEQKADERIAAAKAKIEETEEEYESPDEEDNEPEELPF